MQSMHGPYANRINRVRANIARLEKCRPETWPSASLELRWLRRYVRNARKLGALYKRAHHWYCGKRQWGLTR